MSIVFKGKNNGGGSTGSFTAFADTTPSAGDDLIFVIARNTTTGSVSSISSTGATWTKAGSFQTPNYDIEVWIAPNVSAGASQSISVSVSGAAASNWACLRYTGLDTGGALDGSAAGNGGTGTTFTTSTLTTTNASDLLIAAIIESGSATLGTGGTGWTTRNQLNVTGFGEMTVAEQITSATGSYSATYSDTPNSQLWNSIIVGFKAASSSFPGSKTQPATARIQASPTKTQAAVARIQNVVTKTQPAIARIQNSFTKTQPATARIQVTGTKTQPSIARVQSTGSKTQTAIARIQSVATKAQTATARIVSGFTAIQTATARIQVAKTATQSAIARIQTTGTATQTATARIGLNTTKTQTATARIVVNTGSVLDSFTTSPSEGAFDRPNPFLADP